MTFDECIDRLTERHEALTQSVESVLVTARLHDQQISEIMEAAARLLHIAQIHEARVSRLEDQKRDDLTH